jgi:hypothetical protein
MLLGGLNLLQILLMARTFGTKIMYNSKDIKKISTSSQSPDGMIDETEFVRTLQKVADLIRSTNFSTTSGRTEFGLELINIACNGKDEPDLNSSINVVISLSHHISNLISSLKSIEGVDIEKYFKEYQSNYLDELNESPVIPYYES